MSNVKAIQPAARINALQKFLGGNTSLDDIELNEHYSDATHFNVGDEEYLVLTDSEADGAARVEIRNSLWAFNTQFILNHSRNGVNAASSRVKDALRKMQEALCDDANEIVFALIEDFDAFVKDVVSADGRGHFLSGYDGEENEVKVGGEYFYIYRVN